MLRLFLYKIYSCIVNTTGWSVILVLRNLNVYSLLKLVSPPENHPWDARVFYMQIMTPPEGVDARLEVTDHVSYALNFLDISVRELESCD